MRVGPKPQPTYLKIVRGNPGKRPLPKAEAKVAPAMPIPPAHLSEEARAEWEMVSAELFRAGLLSGIDRAVLAAYCQAYGRWVQAERAIAEMAKRDQLTGGLMIKTTNGNAIQNPLVGTANKAAGDMVRFAVEFGMSPSARSRISAAPPSEEDADPARKYIG